MHPSPCRRLLPVALLLAAIALTAAPARAQHDTQRGATLGGLAGAVAGGLIGNQKGKTGRGAAVGGALGAVTGGLLGNAADKDAELARQRAYQQQQLHAQQHAVQTQGAVSIQDVITMSRSGLGDSVIVNQIRTRGIQQTPQVSDIIAMHDQGVRENVISAMQEARVAGESASRSAVPRTVVSPSPVIIHEREVLPYYSGPRYYGPHHHYHHGPRHRRYRGGYEFHIGF